MASSTAHSRLANSQRVLGCSAGSACRSEAGMPGSCSYTPKHRAAVLLLWGRLREHAPGRAPRSRPSRAAGLQTDKHVRPKKKSRLRDACRGRRAGPEDVEHGEHVELHEADEAARRLDRDGLNLAHLDAEYLPDLSKSPQISPISRGLEEARGVQQRRRAQKCRGREREREREFDDGPMRPASPPPPRCPHLASAPRRPTPGVYGSCTGSNRGTRTKALTRMQPSTLCSTAASSRTPAPASSARCIRQQSAASFCCRSGGRVSP